MNDVINDGAEDSTNANHLTRFNGKSALVIRRFASSATVFRPVILSVSSIAAAAWTTQPASNTHPARR